jgi:trehalose 2-sulfotransferase
VAGHPHEYFEPGTEQANRARWEVDSFEEYLACVLATGTTENGVFAASVMWPSFAGLLDRIGDRNVTMIERTFPHPRFAFLWRENVVAQAVSWSRAAQIGYYHQWDTAHEEATFDPEQIDALVGKASENQAAWRRWFDAHDIEALPIRFEELVRDKEATALRVLAFLGIELLEGATIRERTARAPDAGDEDWVARYRSLRSSLPRDRA